ncbi:MAG TPA: thiolase family protein [Candidatus Tectomicrobia bacterium]|jgi:acetyl-CoA C-acetyltransferase|nr:thiolase family protein [Candidatus Tectomicrobia bacterium]
MREVVIVSAVRTPIGSFNGAFSSIPATKLGALVVAEAVRRAGIPKDAVDEVIMGNVIAAGLGQAPARQASIYAGLPEKVEALTVNKMCGSSLKAAMLAAQAIMCGDADVVIAGGMENMTQAPYLLEKARTGYRLGHGQILDSLLRDGLIDVYNDAHMGNCAELCADRYGLSREELDAFAIRSYQKAIKAQREGLFKEEILPVQVPQGRREPLLVEHDEEPTRVSFEKLPQLAPAFQKDGKVTAGNASSINDGAAAVAVVGRDVAEKMGLQPMARIVASSAFAQQPEWFTTAPAGAIKKVLAKAGLGTAEIDLFEINEAFAAVSLAVNRELGIDEARVNVNGGAVALGHPVGASGARVLTTLLYAMRARGARRGVASLCLAGGEAVAMVVESV